MFRFLWRATKGYRLRPWKSPYLRWRIETYWGLHAEEIGFREFWGFAWKQRRDLRRFLKWAVANRPDVNRPRIHTPGTGPQIGNEHE